jgi:argininosuccinate lyase
MSAKLWDRGAPLDQSVERFTVGRDPELDLQLVAYDALASAAHAAMLQQIGVLEPAEVEALTVELRTIAEEARAGSFVIAVAEEDCHTAIENRLTERLGEAGRRIHTGRSRNDQILAALRLFARDALLRIAGRLLDVVDDLLGLARRERETSMPGYTHTRQAMPSTLGQLFAAHVEGLLDALPWLRVAHAHINRSPLGSASGYGVALPLDRPAVADLLGFEAVQTNTIAVQNDRGKSEFLLLAAVAAPAVDLGRLAADLIWLSSEEFGFVGLSEDVTTGSSIMPQKRNPDVLELIRANAQRLRGRQAEVGSVFATLTSGYHRDLQLTKEPFLEGLAQAEAMFTVMRPVLAGLTVDHARCAAAMDQAIGATDVVYQRVAKGEPFRRAYKAVANDPAGASTEDPAELWRARTHLGAPGALELAPYHERATSGRGWVNETTAAHERIWALLS